MATRAKKKSSAPTKAKTKAKAKAKPKAKADVVVANMSIPFSPSGCALSPDGTRLVVSTDSRGQGEKAPSLVVFDLTKKRAALSLSDPGTVVLERAPHTEYLYGRPLWAAGDRIVFVRPAAQGKVQLVVRTPVADGPVSTLTLGASGSLVAVDGDRVCVTAAKRSGGDSVCRVYALPEPGRAFGDALYEDKKAWPYAFAGGRLWMIGDDGFFGVDRDERASRLPNAPEFDTTVRFAGHGSWLVCWKDYMLRGIDVERGAATDVDGPGFDYKNAVATHDGRALVATSVGALALVSFANGKVLWQKKVAGSRSSPDHITFAGDGKSAVAGAAFEPFRIYKLTIA